ncbi:hypothetical protein FOA52_002038 [Chlamydomonas sp. UWO 241]|nr:hypothetical protein FOA52_002038 [Chlamydomonas sp. UWO 241]
MSLRAGIGPSSRLAASRQCVSGRRALCVSAAGGAQPAAGKAIVYVRTPWPKAFIHGSVSGDAWKDLELRKVTSAPGHWMSVEVPVPRGASPGAPLIEFVVTNNAGEWDKPHGGGNYVVQGPGRFTVQGGALAAVAVAPPPVMVVSDLDGTRQGRGGPVVQRGAFAAVAVVPPPVMVVLDLDRTMVGDDAGTSAFRDFWLSSAVPRGSKLVYNTGRALKSFQALMKEKAHCMAHPDALISAVGTKVYLCSPEGKWAEDTAWSSTLNDAWDVEAVRETGYKALATVGMDLMHFRPKEELNEHKITCGVHTSVLERVLDNVRSGLGRAGVKANVITSGSGDWRYLDLVPIRAGKLQALEYVRKMHVFPIAHTVACGDSGNDILMLMGANPAIVVGNAQPDLRAWASARSKHEPAPPAGSPPRLLLVEKPEAYGILEGLEMLGLLH